MDVVSISDVVSRNSNAINACIASLASSRGYTRVYRFNIHVLANERFIYYPHKVTIVRLRSSLLCVVIVPPRRQPT